MHVPPIAIPFLIISFLLSLCVPLGFLIYFRKRYNVSLKTVLIGVAVWFVFTQVLEKLLHLVVISTTSILHHPVLFSFYGAVVAGIFEESGRLLAFTKILKNQREWKDGVAYGIGHGGIESLLLGGLSSLQTIILYQMIQTGSFSQIQSKLSPLILSRLKAALVLPDYTYLLIGVERVFAFFIQIALTLVVLYAIRTKKWTYFILAIGLHALFDFAPALYQMKLVSLPVTELMVGIFGIISLVAIFKMKKVFVSKKGKAS